MFQFPWNLAHIIKNKHAVCNIRVLENRGIYKINALIVSEI